jgi:hypothetical protein
MGAAAGTTATAGSAVETGVLTPQAADRWTWLLIAAHTQLRLARPLAADLRRPWERPAPPPRLSDLSCVGLVTTLEVVE